MSNVFAVRNFETPLVTVAPVSAANTTAVVGAIEAGGTGADEGCWDTAAHRNTSITTCTEIKTVANTVVTLENANKAAINAIRTALRNLGLLA